MMPMIVMVGKQSTGKSTILQGLTRIPFPQGKGALLAELKAKVRLLMVLSKPI